jgi:hypothetical protein
MFTNLSSTVSEINSIDCFMIMKKNSSCINLWRIEILGVQH